MSNLIKLSLLLIGLLLSTVSISAELTKESVANLLNTVDQAANDHNAGAIAGVMADDVKIVMNVEFQGQTQVAKPSKNEYLSLLEQGWAQVSNYNYSKSDVNIEVEGSKAFVSATVHESMTIQGQDIAASSKEEAIVELVGGKLLITEIVGYVSM